MKYEWSEIDAYENWRTLVDYVEKVLREFGNEYVINLVVLQKRVEDRQSFSIPVSYFPKLQPCQPSSQRAVFLLIEKLPPALNGRTAEDTAVYAREDSVWESRVKHTTII